MEKTYSNRPEQYEIIKAKPETVSFLLNYSKSLKITKTNSLQFESNLN